MQIHNNTLITECSAYDFKEMLERKKVKSWLKSVSAFANTDGGSLFYGVNAPQAVGFVSVRIDLNVEAVRRQKTAADIVVPHTVLDAVQQGVFLYLFTFHDTIRVRLDKDLSIFRNDPNSQFVFVHAASNSGTYAVLAARSTLSRVSNFCTSSVYHASMASSASSSSYSP